MIEARTSAAARPERDGETVTICCLACGTVEAASSDLMVDGSTIVCRNCGDTWPVRSPPRSGGTDVQIHFGGRPTPKTLEAERRPLISYSKGVDTAWADKLASDNDRPSPRPSRLPMAASLVASVLFLAAFFGGRDAVVGSMPDLAGLYSAIGLPVNLAGLDLAGVTAARGNGPDSARVTISGAIRNATRTSRGALPLTVELTDASGAAVMSRVFNPPTRAIAPGAAQPFTLSLAAVPKNAARIVLRFHGSAKLQVATREGGAGT